MLEKIYRRLGKPQKHTIRHSAEMPRSGRMTWSCRCSPDYIDTNSSLREPEIMQVTPCRSHGREGEKEELADVV